jgi:hypothetical protein
MRGVVCEPRCEAVSFSRRVSGSYEVSKRFNTKPLQDFDSLRQDSGRLRPYESDSAVGSQVLRDAAPRISSLLD